MTNNEEILSIPLNETQYEWIELPSKGECYSHKKGRIPVAYMIATDENIVTSEKLKNKRKVCETLLTTKILDKSFKANELCIGDWDAILLWLRKTSYGNEYKVFDENYNEQIIDLNSITYNIPDIKADENGLYQYVIDGNVIKYRLLTHKDDDMFFNELIERLKSDDMNEDELNDIIKHIMILQTESINNISDKNYIFKFVNDLSLSKLLSYFNFTSKNTPRVNIDIRIGDTFFDDIK